MKRLYLVIVTVSLFAVNYLPAQDKKPDWRKLHYLSEEEMYKEFDNTLNFYETDPPTPPVRNVAEFDPMQAVLIRSPFGIPMTLVKEMADDLEVITIVANASQEQAVLTQYVSNNVDTSNCSFIYAPSDSYWTRDYGPWFVFDGDNQPGIVNFPYNRPRPNDNDIPIQVANYLGIDLYGMNLTHTGGNYMTDGMGISASTDLVLEENPSLTEEDVDSLVYNYLGIQDYFALADPLDEYIKHIDCWGKFLSPGKVLIGKVPESDYRYEDFEAAATFFKTTNSSFGRPYEVIRVMTPGGSPATAYTNSLILNNKVFVPLSGSSWDDDAIEVYEEAMPGYEIVGINFGSWENTDALHCRAKGIADLGMLYIHHVPLLGTVGLQEEYEIAAEIIPCSGENVYSDSALIFYSINGGSYQSASMTQQEGNTWSGTITGVSGGDNVGYYLYVADESGRHTMNPYIGEPDPYEFTVFGAQGDVLSLIPDSLIFLTYDDCVNGLTLSVINISSDSVEITGITPGATDGFMWEVEELPELPFTLPAGDTLALNVLVGIPTRSYGEMLQDTLFVTLVDDEYSSLIIVDSDLVQALDENPEAEAVEVYPNPFSDELTFEFVSVPGKEMQIELFDIAGKRIYSQNFPGNGLTGTVTINTAKAGIKTGTYFYRLTLKGKTYSGKVICNN